MWYPGSRRKQRLDGGHDGWGWKLEAGGALYFDRFRLSHIQADQQRGCVYLKARGTYYFAFMFLDKKTGVWVFAIIYGVGWACVAVIPKCFSL